MSKTTVIIFHINEFYSIGFHNAIASELYFEQSSGDIYSCMVRNKKITNKSAILDILAIGLTTDVIHVVPNGDYIDKWKSNLSIDDFINSKIDKVDVIHEKHKIKHYIPYKQLILDNDIITEYYDQYKLFISKKQINNVYNVKCLIWKLIKSEERVVHDR